MLTSRKLELRRSEVRQSLAELAANDNLTEEQRAKGEPNPRRRGEMKGR